MAIRNMTPSWMPTAYCNNNTMSAINYEPYTLLDLLLNDYTMDDSEDTTYLPQFDLTGLEDDDIVYLDEDDLLDEEMDRITQKAETLSFLM
jgi:hypothetical protein